MSQASHGIADDGDASLEVVGQSPKGFGLEPRCRVCRNDTVRQKVNDMLATGASYAMIVRALQDDNSKLDTRDRVTVDSIRNHCGRHFPVQNAAKATYREIVERRAQEAGVDFVNGVASAITPAAFFETIVVKSYESLVDSGGKIDVNTGMAAAGKLQAFIESQSGQTDVADVLARQNRIISAMREFVSPEELPAFLAKIEGTAPPQIAASSVDGEITEVEEFDPGGAADDDDDDFDD